MGFWNVQGAHAYAVISGTLTVTIQGQAVARTGTLALYVFEARRGLEDRRPGVGTHNVERASIIAAMIARNPTRQSAVEERSENASVRALRSAHLSE